MSIREESPLSSATKFIKRKFLLTLISFTFKFVVPLEGHSGLPIDSNYTFVFWVLLIVK